MNLGSGTSWIEESEAEVTAGFEVRRDCRSFDGGFRRRTSSRRRAYVLDDLFTRQPWWYWRDVTSGFACGVPRPVEVWPESSKEVTPTTASQSRSLSSRPSSEAKEYANDEMGSE